MAELYSKGGRTFVGFGFGAIQAGLFLYEAFRSGNFERLVVAYRRPEVIAALRRAGGCYALNIAHHDRIETVRVGPVEFLDMHEANDRARLIDAVAGASELATALSSVDDYCAPGDASVHHVLAEGLAAKLRQAGPRAVVYAAENHNHAAEQLRDAVMEIVPASVRGALQERVQFLNTVIGKMSQRVHDLDQLAQDQLEPITPELPQAFLVESFRCILVSRPQFAEPLTRGLDMFIEKADLLPFEEAKLYGHNAIHALAGYIAQVRGLTQVAELASIPGAVQFLEAAFVEESGGALIRKYRGLDPLFTPEGYRRYARDLLTRIMNPYLRDSVARVVRDPRRKLGWDDRLVGTIRLALGQKVTPKRYAFGTAAALRSLSKDAPLALLSELWQSSSPDARGVLQVLDEVSEANERFAAWEAAGYPPLEAFFVAG